MTANAANKTAHKDVVEVETDSVPCDGGTGALGHPRVWIALKGGAGDCPYCGRHFTLKPGAKVGHH